MKIFVSQVAHETNTFAADRTDTARFKQLIWLADQEVLERQRGSTDYVSGMLSKAEELGVELVPGFSAFNVGGLILKETYLEIKNNIITRLQSVVNEIDGVCISLHGAAVVEGIDDLEEDIVRAVREVIGYEKPMAATFDLHGNISKAMADMLDAIVNCKEYPHIDCHVAGAKAIEILANCINNKNKSTVAYRRIPMIVPPAMACTFDSPAVDVKHFMAKLAEKEGVLDVSFFHGFPYADLPICNASVMVTTDGNKELAEKTVEEAAKHVWDRRHDFDSSYLSVEQAMDAALAIEGGPIVINETSDNPGGGTPADGTHLLREMLKRNAPKTCFGFIYDPEFVLLAEKAGVGNLVSGKLGAKTDKIHGEPIDVVDAYVKVISDGKFISANPVFVKGNILSIGKSVRVVIGNVDVIVASVRFQTGDHMLFQLHGIDVMEYKIVALKSTQHFRAVFNDLAKEIVTADPPGIHTANFAQLPYSRLTHPLYPFEDNFEPEGF